MKNKIKRFERKWLFKSNNSLSLINALIRSNLFFRTQYPSRKVNSIYFDTQSFDFLYNNINGVKDRKKVRLRWYNEDYLNNTLEIKKKLGFVGWKESFQKISSFKNSVFNNLNDKTNFLNKVNHLAKSNINPILKIVYKREYFLSFCNKFRSTLDTDIKVFSLNNSKIYLNLNKSILEMKYNIEFDDDYRKFINQTNFNFRLQKFSKYANSAILLKRNGLI